jgi:muramoyltetrapeptide carboxypeptidase
METIRVDVIAPSGAVLSPEAFESGLERLRGLGCSVRNRVPSKAWLRFSDTDEGRLGQIHASASAPDVDLVMTARGGYGLSRLLHRINWPLVAESVRRGVRWVGFSDFTAFHLALLARTGAVSWAGPTICADFGQDELDPYTLDQLRCLLLGQAPLVEWPVPDSEAITAPASSMLASGLMRASASSSVASEPMPNPQLSTALSIEGTLWGGNLAMLASLVGTAWMPKIEGGLLFIEDVAEHPYRVERMLLQLLQAGVLERQRAILFGAFTGWSAAPHDNGFGIESVISHLAERLRVPLIQGLPFGHIRRRAVLGVGLRYRLERKVGGTGWRLFPMSASTESQRCP